MSSKPLKLSVLCEEETSEHMSETDSLGIDVTESESDDAFGGHCKKVIIL